MSPEANKRLEKYSNIFDEIISEILSECKNYKITKEIYLLEKTKTDIKLQYYIKWVPKPNDVKFKCKLYILLTDTNRKSEAAFKSIPKDERPEFIYIFNANTEDLLLDITDNAVKYFDIKESIKEKPEIFAKKINKECVKEKYSEILKDIINKVNDNMNKIYVLNDCKENSLLTANKTGENRFKMKWNISVSKFVFLFRILKEHKILEITQMMDFFRFLSDNCQTNGAEELSIKSIKNHFNNPTSKTIEYWDEKFLHFKQYTTKNK